MRLQVRHATRYVYEAPVWLNVQLIRLKPRSDAAQRLESFHIHIDPAPAGQSDLIEPDGGEALSAWFEDSASYLRVMTRSVVDTLRCNPFDFLWQGEHELPLRYEKPAELALASYTRPSRVPGSRALVGAAASNAGGDAALFPVSLAGVIFGSFSCIIREEGEPLPPEETMRRGEGSCRDLTVLFMECARSAGFAARFVSGYLADEGRASHELHAWAELYLPGGGWRGFDPTTGLAVADMHVAVAAATDPQMAAPVSGSYRGAARSHLETAVSVRRIESAAGARMTQTSRQG